MKDIEFNYTLTISERANRETVKLFLASRLYQSMLVLAVSVVVISIYLYMEAFIHGSHMGMLLLGSLLIVALPVVSVLNIEIGKDDQSFTFYVNEDYFKVVGEESWSELRWPGFSRIKETNSYFFLNFQGLSTSVIFKDKLTDEQVSEIRKILAATPVRKKKLFQES